MKNQKLMDKITKYIIILFSFISLGALFWIMGYIILKGIPHVDWTFLSTQYRGSQHGIYPMIISTFYVVIASLIISVPIGISSAIYLVEYSKPGRIVNIIRFATEALAGIPSIIFGLFGYIFLVITLNLKMSILSGAITLSIVVLPVIIRTTEEALKTVPNSFREGSLALGATKLTTIWKVILPSAIGGILTGIILSVGRIVGETAAVYLTAGMVTRIPESVMNSGRTLAVHLYILAKEGISFEQAYATATVLLIIVAILNFSVTIIAKSIRRRLTGI